MAKKTLYKVTLSTGKVVVLTKLLIETKNNAVQAAAQRLPADSPQAVFNTIMGDELLRLLIISVNGKEIDSVSRENIDSILEFSEYTEISEVVGGMISAGESKKKPIVEMMLEA